MAEHGSDMPATVVRFHPVVPFSFGEKMFIRIEKTASNKWNVSSDTFPTNRDFSTHREVMQRTMNKIKGILVADPDTPMRITIEEVAPIEVLGDNVPAEESNDDTEAVDTNGE